MEKIYFDTDSLSCFLRIDKESVVACCFEEYAFIPMPVLEELSNPEFNKKKPIKAQIDVLLKLGQAIPKRLMDENTLNLYVEIKDTISFDKKGKKKIMGKGESSVIAYAVNDQRTISSNNLKDVSFYVQKYNLKNYKTGDILRFAYNKGYISLAEANTIWKEILSVGQRIGYASFDEFLEKNP